MKIYAVIEECSDYYYPDYTIVDDCVYLKEEDAIKRLEELTEKYRYTVFKIRDFEVKE